MASFDAEPGYTDTELSLVLIDSGENRYSCSEIPKHLKGQEVTYTR